MGIDVMMDVRAPRPVNQSELLRLSFETCSAFGVEHFSIDRSNGTHALTLNTIGLDSPDKADSFSVNLNGRLYDIGYERGNLMLYLNLARWFREKIPGCTVYYYGDIDIGDPDVETELTSEREEQLWRQFLDVQHHPYRAVTASELTSNDGPVYRWCDFCQEAMTRSGSSYVSFRCAGCGLLEITQDGKKTWYEAERE